MPLVSIVVRSMNDIAFISRTLEMIRRQTFSDFELLNVDSGSTDGTYEAVREFNPDKQWRIRPEEYVPGRVLNHAVSECSGSIVLFNNSDCVPLDEQWLGNLIQPLRDYPEVAATFGNQLPRPDALPLVVKDNIRAYGDGKESATWRHFFSLATSAAPRKLLLEFPFDESLQYSEDIDWSWRMRRMGRRLVYVPSARVEHSHNYTLAQVRKRFFNEGIAEGRIYGEQVRFLRDFAGPLAAEALRDIAYLLKKGKLSHIPHGLVYRFVQRRAVYMGRRSFFLNGGA